MESVSVIILAVAAGHINIAITMIEPTISNEATAANTTTRKIAPDKTRVGKPKIYAKPGSNIESFSSLKTKKVATKINELIIM